MGVLNVAISMTRPVRKISDSNGADTRYNWVLLLVALSFATNDVDVDVGSALR
jgi:hypothetical protein